MEVKIHITQIIWSETIIFFQLSITEWFKNRFPAVALCRMCVNKHQHGQSELVADHFPTNSLKALMTCQPWPDNNNSYLAKSYRLLSKIKRYEGWTAIQFKALAPVFILCVLYAVLTCREHHLFPGLYENTPVTTCIYNPVSNFGQNRYTKGPKSLWWLRTLRTNKTYYKLLQVYAITITCW